MASLIPPPDDFAEQFQTSLESLQAIVSNSPVVASFDNAQYEVFTKKAMEPLGFYVGQVAAKFGQGTTRRTLCFNTQKTLNVLGGELIKARETLPPNQQRDPLFLRSQRQRLAAGIQSLASFVLDEVPNTPKNRRVRARASQLSSIALTSGD